LWKVSVSPLFSTVIKRKAYPAPLIKTGVSIGDTDGRENRLQHRYNHLEDKQVKLPEPSRS
jgi:hypothetical protein